VNTNKQFEHREDINPDDYVEVEEIIKQYIPKENEIHVQEFDDIIKFYNLKRGDILLSEGFGYFIDNAIKFFTKCFITHVMLVQEYKGEFYVIESTIQMGIDKYPDYIHKKIKSGPMMVPFKKRFETYRGIIFVRPISKRLPDSYGDLIHEFYKGASEFKYETNYIELFNCFMKINRGNKTTTGPYFCSELIAEIFQSIGLLKPPKYGGISSEYYSPEDWINVPLLSGCGYTLGKPRFILPPLEYLEERNLKLKMEGYQ